MTATERSRLVAWDFAVDEFRRLRSSHQLFCGPDGSFVTESVSRPFKVVMINCYLAGFATPMEVAYGGRA